ncbi:remorin-like [Malania oleifera]|uniref:remorin-like n=1 Tax=Malania oleifera TaxID=397392 RepID=UPI0025ADA03D|nr:remorin-like [Malania oleifera]
MDALIKQMGLRYGAGEENKEQPSVNRERSIPLQKTLSFKGEKKKNQSWLRKSFSRQRGQDDDSKEIEYATAVAAAAFAINSLEESGIPIQKKTSEVPETSKAKVKSKKEDTAIAIPEPGKVSRRFSGETSMRSSEGPDMIVPISDAALEKMPGKTVGPAPSIRKTPTVDNQLKNTSSQNQETAAPKPEAPSALQQPAFQSTGAKRQSSTRIGGTKADAWEKAEMDKIKHWYEKLSKTITSWEENKKKKARRRKDKIEGELERRRVKATQRYNRDMKSIDQIARAAELKAKERRRLEESKVKEKTDKIRETGKDPTTCSCF